MSLPSEQESAELVERIERLYQYINNGAEFPGLDPAEQDRLQRQQLVMEAYADVLGERIDALPGTRGARVTWQMLREKGKL